MDILEYRKIINKTAIYPKEFGLGYCTLGLIGETGEFLEKLNKDKKDYKGIQKEIGDCIWYFTAICNEININDSIYVELMELLIERFAKRLLILYKPNLLIESCKLSEIVKKSIRDDIDKHEEILEKLRHYIIDLYRTIDNLDFKFDIHEILEINYNKLIKRRETNTLNGSGDDREERAGDAKQTWL